LSVIDEDYKIYFKEIPPSVHLRNNRSARDNSVFVSTEISKLLGFGFISEVKFSHILFTVAFNKTGKACLVLDCRHINLFLQKIKFKYEVANLVGYMFSHGYFLFTFDLKSASPY